MVLLHLLAGRRPATLLPFWRLPVKGPGSSTWFLLMVPGGAHRTFCQACPASQWPSIFFCHQQRLFIWFSHTLWFFSCRTWSHGNKVSFQGSSGLNVTLSMKLRITALTCLLMLTAVFFWKDSMASMCFIYVGLTR